MEGGFLDGLGRLVADELDADHQAGPADVDDRLGPAATSSMP